MISGIYKIVCTNGKYYYGSSNNIERRWGNHKRSLRKNRHFNLHLQNAWNLYGEATFRLEIEKEVPVELLLNVEQTYLDEHVGSPNCFNIAIDAAAPNRGLKHSPLDEETRRKMSERMKGKKNHLGRSHSKESRLKMSRWQIGRKLSEETKRKMSANMREKSHGSMKEETKRKLRALHLGKKLSVETRRKISETLLNRKSKLI